MHWMVFPELMNNKYKWSSIAKRHIAAAPPSLACSVPPKLNSSSQKEEASVEQQQGWKDDVKVPTFLIIQGQVSACASCPQDAAVRVCRAVPLPGALLKTELGGTEETRFHYPLCEPHTAAFIAALSEGCLMKCSKSHSLHSPPPPPRTVPLPPSLPPTVMQRTPALDSPSPCWCSPSVPWWCTEQSLWVCALSMSPSRQPL